MSTSNSQTTTLSLLRLAHDLLYLGSDGLPIYSDEFTKLNKEVFQLANEVFDLKGDSPEEEARICLALLMGYSATIYNYGDKEERIQTILNRSWEVLDNLSPSLLKVQLLTYCYGEVFDEELAREAYEIMKGWTDRKLSEEEEEIFRLLKGLEENGGSEWEIKG